LTATSTDGSYAPGPPVRSIRLLRRGDRRLGSASSLGQAGHWCFDVPAGDRARRRTRLRTPNHGIVPRGVLDRKRAGCTDRGRRFRTRNRRNRHRRCGTVAPTARATTLGRCPNKRNRALAA
jgi:hypothetical protein